MSPYRVKLAPDSDVLHARSEVLSVAADMARCTGLSDDALTPEVQEVPLTAWFVATSLRSDSGGSTKENTMRDRCPYCSSDLTVPAAPSSVDGHPTLICLKCWRIAPSPRVGSVMVPDTTPQDLAQAIEDRDDAYQMCQMLQRRLDDYVAMEGRLNMEINAALNERDEAREERDSAQQMVGVLINSLDECRDRGMALVAELRSRGWTGEVEDL